jgi:hypothetical protein
MPGAGRMVWRAACTPLDAIFLIATSALWY